MVICIVGEILMVGEILYCWRLMVEAWMVYHCWLLPCWFRHIDRLCLLNVWYCMAWLNVNRCLMMVRLCSGGPCNMNVREYRCLVGLD